MICDESGLDNPLTRETRVEEGSGFNEAAYLAANPDVAAALATGAFRSGQQHYEQYGRFEGRCLYQ